LGIFLIGGVPGASVAQMHIRNVIYDNLRFGNSVNFLDIQMEKKGKKEKIKENYKQYIVNNHI
jgi:hypothetical protein